MIRLSLLPVLALALTACAPGSAVNAATSGDAADGGYLFGAKDEQIDAIATARGLDRDQLASRLEAPFQCERYEGLCETVGREEAEQLAGDQWSLALQGASDEEMLELDAAAFIEAGAADSAGDSPPPPAADVPADTEADAGILGLPVGAANCVSVYASTGASIGSVCAWRVVDVITTTHRTALGAYSKGTLSLNMKSVRLAGWTGKDVTKFGYTSGSSVTNLSLSLGIALGGGGSCAYATGVINGSTASSSKCW